MSKLDDSLKEDNSSSSSSSKPKIRNFAIAGAISGVLTRALGQPLDVVKVRFQLQTEPISRKNEDSKYRHTVQALRLIFHEEGVKGLWRGHVAAQALSVIYGLVQFQVYEVLKMNLLEFKLSKGYDVEHHNTTIHFVCGGIAGSVATFASFPCDIIRTRLIAQGNNRHYRGVIHGITTIYKQEGAFAYFRGLTPALIVAGPLIGFQFTFYEFFKSVIEYFNNYGVRKDKSSTNIVGNLLAGSMAGLCSKLVTYPFDLARKRMQVQNFQYARVGFGQNFWCNGLMSCFLTTLQNEKFLGVYKGLAPSLAKATVTTALHFTFYEESVRLLNKYL